MGDYAGIRLPNEFCLHAAKSTTGDKARKPQRSKIASALIHRNGNVMSWPFSRASSASFQANTPAVARVCGKCAEKGASEERSREHNTNE